MMLQNLFDRVEGFEVSSETLLLQDLEEMKYFRIKSGYTDVFYVLVRRGSRDYLYDCVQYNQKTKEIRDIRIGGRMEIVETRPIFKNKDDFKEQ